MIFILSWHWDTCWCVLFILSWRIKILAGAWYLYPLGTLRYMLVHDILSWHTKILAGARYLYSLDTLRYLPVHDIYTLLTHQDTCWCMIFILSWHIKILEGARYLYSLDTLRYLLVQDIYTVLNPVNILNKFWSRFNLVLTNSCH